MYSTNFTPNHSPKVIHFLFNLMPTPFYLQSPREKKKLLKCFHIWCKLDIKGWMWNILPLLSTHQRQKKFADVSRSTHGETMEIKYSYIVLGFLDLKYVKTRQVSENEDTEESKFRHGQQNTGKTQDHFREYNSNWQGWLGAQRLNT